MCAMWVGRGEERALALEQEDGTHVTGAPQRQVLVEAPHLFTPSLPPSFFHSFFLFPTSMRARPDLSYCHISSALCI